MLTRKLGWSWGLLGCHLGFWRAKLSKNRNSHNFWTKHARNTIETSIPYNVDMTNLFIIFLIFDNALWFILLKMVKKHSEGIVNCLKEPQQRKITWHWRIANIIFLIFLEPNRPRTSFGLPGEPWKEWTPIELQEGSTYLASQERWSFAHFPVETGVVTVHGL